MNFYTTSTFRQTLTSLTKKPKEGYKYVVNDICKALLSIVDLVDEEYDRLLLEMVMENNNKTLHQVDINNSLAELDTNTSMF